MKKLIGSAALFIFLCFSAFAQQRITLTITVTNPPVSGDKITINGAMRMWTNAEASSTILTNLTGINASKTNALRQFSRWLFAGPLNLVDNGTNSFKVVAPLSGVLSASTVGTWATLTLSTQSGAGFTYTAIYPLENMVSATDRVNQASSLVYGLGTYSSNAFATNSTAISNVLNKGASPLQRVASPVLFESVGGNVSAMTNGYLTNQVIETDFTNRLKKIVIPNGGSITAGTTSSPPVFYTSQGMAAVGTTPQIILIGLSTTPTLSGQILLQRHRGGEGTTTNVLAGDTVGTFQILGKGETVYRGALNIRAIAYGDFADASAPTRVEFLVGPTNSGSAGQSSFTMTYTDNTNNMAAWFNSNVVFVANTYVSNLYASGGISMNQSFLNMSASNLLVRAGSTNVLGGDLSMPWYSLSTLANGNNISVPFGTNIMIRLSGTLTSTGSIAGAIAGATSGGRDGQLQLLWNDTGQIVEFKQSTSDPVPANRFALYGGADVTMLPDSFVWLAYSPSSARWKIVSQYPNSTNVIASSSGVSVTNLLWGKTLFVDSVNGVNATAVRGDASHPWITLTSAKLAALSGDRIDVRPGFYEGTNLWKTGVNWHFASGTFISNISANASGIFDNTELGTQGAITSSITGDAVFYVAHTDTTRTNETGTISVVNSNSQIYIHCKSIWGGPDNTSYYALCLRDGTVTVECDDINPVVAAGGPVNSAVMWNDGQANLTCNSIFSDNGYGIWGNGFKPGNFHVTCKTLVTTNYSAVFWEPTHVENKLWLHVNEMFGNSGGVTLGVVTLLGGKMYINGQKIYSQLGVNQVPVFYQAETKCASHIWVNSQKVTITNEAPFLQQLGGRADFTVQEWHDDGSSANRPYSWIVTGGTNNVHGGRFLTRGGPMLKSDGGLSVFNGAVIDTSTSNQSTNYPIWMSGGAVTLNNCTLIAPASAFSVGADAAANVRLQDVRMNKLMTNTIAALVGPWTVDANVQ